MMPRSSYTIVPNPASPNWAARECRQCHQPIEHVDSPTQVTHPECRKAYREAQKAAARKRERANRTRGRVLSA